jgi:hypothetical protein
MIFLFLYKQSCTSTKLTFSQLRFARNIHEGELASLRLQRCETVKANHLNGHKKRNRSLLRRIRYAVRGLFDYIQIILLLWTKRRIDNILFTKPSFIIQGQNGEYHDRILSTIEIGGKSICINYSRSEIIDRVEGIRVYNVGIAVRLFEKVCLRKRNFYTSIWSYLKVLSPIVNRSEKLTFFIPCYYDSCGLSLAFSKRRKNFKLVEVQHGSIINFPPYSVEAKQKLVDVIYVKNQRTVRFLNDNIYSQFRPEYILIPNRIIKRRKGELKKCILYCSSVELEGFHPAILDYYRNNDTAKLDLIIRLHPGEKDKKQVFENQLTGIKCNYRFDETKSWKDTSEQMDVIVVSPWSSIIEEAYDNGVKTIIIDERGYSRYKDIVDDAVCFYSADLKSTLRKL